MQQTAKIPIMHCTFMTLLNALHDPLNDTDGNRASDTANEKWTVRLGNLKQPLVSFLSGGNGWDACYSFHFLSTSLVTADYPQLVTRSHIYSLPCLGARREGGVKKQRCKWCM
jgi:hypothetical protein